MVVDNRLQCSRSEGGMDDDLARCDAAEVAALSEHDDDDDEAGAAEEEEGGSEEEDDDEGTP